MSGLPIRSRPIAIACEALFAFAIVAAAASTLIDSVQAGYLVQPFVWDASDTFMDWFNTAWWGAHDAGAGAYEVWGSIYPPISFIFLKLVTLQHCYATDPKHARDCDWLGMAAMYGTFLLNMALVAFSYWRWDRNTAPMRFLAILLGLPALHGLERGNLVMITFTFFFLAYAPLLRSARAKWLAAAIAINFKVYLISALSVYIARRKWVAAETTVILTVLVYLFTYAFYGKGLPTEIVENILKFSDTNNVISWQNVYYTTSLNSLLNVVSNNALLLRYIDSDILVYIKETLPFIILGGQLLCVGALLAAFIRPASAPATRLAAIAVTLSIMTSEASGYSYLLVLALIFFEEWKGYLRITALVTAYLMSLTTDYVFSYVVIHTQYSYWANHEVLTKTGIALGQFARPFGLILMIGCLCWLTVQNCYRSVRRDMMKGLPLLPASYHV